MSLTATVAASLWSLTAPASEPETHVAFPSYSASAEPPEEAEAIDFSGRPLYRYSVIPGGAYTIAEMHAALDRDPVVAAHYAHLDRTRLRTETVTHDRYVHVSYRKGNEVFWTKNKVLLRRGETILTDGTTEVRGRCGNCISEQAMAPTSAEEPETVEFDRLMDTPLMARGERGESALAPLDAGAPDEFPALSIGPGGHQGAPGAFGGGAPGGAGAAPLAGGSVSTRESGPSPRPDDATTPPSPSPRLEDIPSPVAELDFPGSNGPGGPSDLFPPGTPGNPIPPTGSQPEIPPPGSPNAPANPVPVPEPGSMLLVGGGAAALLRIIRRRAV
jgi:hypothetical protein